MKNKKIWVVSEVFFPDETSTAYIMTAIAEYLGDYADVHVLCGPEGYGQIVSEESKLTNVTIHRLKAFNLDKNNILFRLLRLLFLSFGMFFFALFKVKKEDKLFLVTNPALSIPLFSLLKKVKRFGYFILVHDVFPENLIPAGIMKSKGNVVYKLLKNIFDWSYRQADELFVLGRDMREIMIAKTKGLNRVSIIENWADLVNINSTSFKENELIKANKLEDKIVFLFAGNIGRLQGLKELFKVISQLQNPELHFLFVGDGALLPELKELKEQRALNNVTFLGTFPRNYQPIFLNAAHFGIVTLEQEVFGLGVPSKSYNILAAGKPILFIGNQSSEIALMVRERSCGVSFSMENPEELLKFFNELKQEDLLKYVDMGANGRQVAEQHYSKKQILFKFKKAIVDADY